MSSCFRFLLPAPFRRFCFGITLIVLAMLSPSPLWAQTPESGLELRLSRDFGYGGFSGDIEGVFSLRVKGPENLAKVTYYIDDQQIGMSTEPPWRYQFNTNDYPLGVHKLYAIGETTAGETLTSNVIRREFVPKGEALGLEIKILVPIIVLSLAIPALVYFIDKKRGGRKSKGYGPFGGAICPKCGKPFARHFWGLNLGAAKYDRCPHCGKWSVVRRAGAQDLAAAEALLDDGQAEDLREPEVPAEEQLKKRLDDSRFEDI